MGRMNAKRWRAAFQSAWGVVPEKWERERFLRFVTITGECWIWHGDKRGHEIGRRYYSPQALAYVLLKGPLNRADQVVATCHRNCCMPDHLVNVSQKKSKKVPQNAG